MSIKADVQELQSIRAEMKNLSVRKKKLREKEQGVEARITSYLKSKEQPGVKYQGIAIKIEEKEVCSSKKLKDKDTDALLVLQRHGVSSPEKVLEALLEARKGSKIVKEKLKMKKYKPETDS